MSSQAQQINQMQQAHGDKQLRAELNNIRGVYDLFS